MNLVPKYDEPSWSAYPVEKFQLEVLKDGLIVLSIDLDKKPYYTLGRQPDLVDIVMEHPSISRMHAVLNFRDDGALMLRDLGSAQGTQLNKQQCEKNTYYRVYVGDMIKFGASTRKYIVMGPESHNREEYNSANMESYRSKLAQRSAEIQAKLDKEDERNAFSWGMREDAEPETNEGDDGDGEQELPEYLRKLKKDENFDRKYGEKFKAEIDETEAKNAKDAEVMDKIRKKERKVQNMQEENRRIYMKEASQENGLTEGQLAAVARNDKAIAALETEIEDLIRQIRSKDRSGQAAARRSAKAREEEDSDMLDVSEQTADSSTNWRLRKKLQKNAHLHGGAGGGGAGVGNTDAEHRSLTYTEIKEQLLQREVAINKLDAEINATDLAMAEQLAIVDASAADVGGSTAESDQIDLVLASDRLAEQRAHLKKLQSDRAAQVLQQSRLQVLLRAATPALSSLAGRPSAPAQVTSTATFAPSNTSGGGGGLPTGVAGPAKATTTANDATETLSNTADDRLSELARLIEAEKVAEAQVAAERKQRDKPASGERQPAKMAPRGNASDAVGSKRAAESEAGADLRTEGQTQPQQEQDAQDHQPAKRQFTAARPPGPVKAAAVEAQDHLRFDSKRLEGGEAAWAPPPNQKGDGRTALNDKFGY